MGFSGLTSSVNISSQSSSRNGSGIDTFLVHHGATTNGPGMVAMMVNRTRQVSANYVMYSDSEASLIGVVDESQRAWTSGSTTDGGRGAQWDRRSITIEVANSGGAAQGWPINDAQYEKLARLLVDLNQRFGIGLHRGAGGVLGHRELWTIYRASYPTACPGGIDLDRIVNRARELQGLPPIPPWSGGGTVPAGTNYAFGLTGEAQLAVQRYLGSLGRYTGVQDGVFGNLSVSAFQQYLKDSGYLSSGYVVDGIPGVNYGKAVQKLAAKHGYTGPIDGYPGPNTSAAIIRWASGSTPPPAPGPGGNTHVMVNGDGVTYWEPRGELAARIQSALKSRGRYSGPVDGVWGTETRRGVQKTLNISGYFRGAEDGILGPGGLLGVQKYARAFGDYTGPLDGKPELMSWQGFALGLERP